MPHSPSARGSLVRVVQAGVGGRVARKLLLACSTHRRAIFVRWADVHNRRGSGSAQGSIARGKWSTMWIRQTRQVQRGGTDLPAPPSSPPSSPPEAAPPSRYVTSAASRRPASSVAGRGGAASQAPACVYAAPSSPQVRRALPTRPLPCPPADSGAASCGASANMAAVAADSSFSSCAPVTEGSVGSHTLCSSISVSPGCTPSMLAATVAAPCSRGRWGGQAVVISQRARYSR